MKRSNSRVCEMPACGQQGLSRRINSLVWNCWTGALARLGVARADALQAKSSRGADSDTARVRALADYKDFLTLWKDADPDIPIFKQARAEYAKLQ
jgi:hypothetical protein